MANIMVVDDDPHVLKLTRNTLQGAGHSVIAFPGPDEALEVYKANPGSVDLLLTDVEMPSMNGVALAAAVREIRPNQRIIIASADLASLSQKGINLPEGVPTIEKPFSLTELIALVQRELAKT